MLVTRLMVCVPALVKLGGRGITARKNVMLVDMERTVTLRVIVMEIATKYQANVMVIASQVGWEIHASMNFPTSNKRLLSNMWMKKHRL